MHVEIWSDIACPWCYVGKRRFEAALAGFEHRDDVQVTWRSFELDPEAPAERPRSGAEHLAEKYGTSLEQAQAMNDRMTEIAATEGLEFHFERARGGNTFDAHRLVHLAAEHGAQDAMKERLMRAYLSEGELMADARPLVRLAGEVGLPEDDVRGAARERPLRRRRARRRAHRRGAGHPAASRSSSSTASSARPARSRRRCSASCCRARGRHGRRSTSSPPATAAASTAADPAGVASHASWRSGAATS